MSPLYDWSAKQINARNAVYSNDRLCVSNYGIVWGGGADFCWLDALFHLAVVHRLRTSEMVCGITYELC